MRLVRCLVPVLFLLAVPLFAQTLEIHYIDVGWGGSVFIKGPTGIATGAPAVVVAAAAFHWSAHVDE